MKRLSVINKLIKDTEVDGYSKKGVASWVNTPTNVGSSP